MIDRVVYIPTKDRPELLARSVASWRYLNMKVYVVTEEQYRHKAKHVVQGQDVHFLFIKQINRGIGFARSLILDHANEQGYRSFMLGDDDHIVHGEVDPMLKFAQREDVVGVGAYKRVYNLFAKDTRMVEAFKAGKGKFFLHKGSVGYQVFAVNTENALKAGGFDKHFYVQEDAELCRKGIVKLGLPWYLYTGTSVTDVSPSGPKLKGGIASIPTSRDEMAMQVQEEMQIRYPGMVNDKLPIRFRWRPLLEKYIPDLPLQPLENWETHKEFDWLKEG